MNFMKRSQLRSIVTRTPGKKKAPKGAFSFDAPRLHRHDAYPLSLFIEAIVRDHPINLREDGVVAPHANVLTRVNARAELAHENVSRAHPLAAEYFDAAPLPLAVSAVARAAAGFFMCHRSCSFLSDLDDLQRRPLLSVPALAAVALAPLLLEDHDLFALALLENFRCNLHVGERRRPDFYLAVAAEHEHLGERDALADGAF